MQRLANSLTFESVSVPRAVRGVPRSGLWSEWAGTLLSRIPEMNQECPRRAEPAARGRKVASVAERKPPASPCAEWPPVPGYPSGGSVRQAISETLHEVVVSREMLSARA